MSGWSAAATCRRNRSLSSSPDQPSTHPQRSRKRCQSSKRPEQPTSSPTITTPRRYTNSWDLTLSRYVYPRASTLYSTRIRPQVLANIDVPGARQRKPAVEVALRVKQLAPSVVPFHEHDRVLLL